MKQKFAEAGVVPVLIFDNAEAAVPTAGALIEGGLSVLEITLRTEAAWAALSAIIEAYPSASIGVGTVLEPEQLKRARDEGARFAVSPGYDPSLVEAARGMGIFYLPGVASASEIMQARRDGLQFLKFFPAETAGGVSALKAFSSPFQDISFCPTGGIGPRNLADYMALDNVRCVGGSWVASGTDIANCNWRAISQKARDALAAIQSS